MKKLQCREIGGACDEYIEGKTFQELGENAKKHVHELLERGDADHYEAAEKMKDMSPDQQHEAMKKWEQKFNDAPDA